MPMITPRIAIERLRTISFYRKYFALPTIVANFQRDENGGLSARASPSQLFLSYALANRIIFNFFSSIFGIKIIHIN